MPFDKLFGALGYPEDALFQMDNYFKPRRYLAGAGLRRGEETGETVTFEVDLPGMGASDVDVSSDNGFVTVKADNGRRTYSKSFLLPDEYSDDGATAKMKNGVLHLTFSRYHTREGTKIKVEE
jgi:HSP20 family molecular chaperone IbpA